jgi:hypothetical protein
MKPSPRPHDELCSFVEGNLFDEADVAVEKHLRGCSRCATYADGYAEFLEAFDSGAEPPELQAAAARLDSRMSPPSRPEKLDSRTARHLRERFSIGELVQEPRRSGPAGATGSAGPTLVWTAADSEPANLVLDQVVVVDEQGVEARTMAYLAGVPRWPADRVDLLLEFDLKYGGWDVLVVYLLEEEPAVPEPSALVLFEGRVDLEGMVEIQRRWGGPGPESFDPGHLRICLAAPSAPG